MLSKDASTLVSIVRDEMSRYITVVSEELEEECHLVMLHDNMDLSMLMVHAQQVEESHLRKKNKKSKKASSFESGSSKSRIDIKDKPKFKKRFSNQVPSNFSRTRNYRVSNHKSQKGRNVDSPRKRLICGKCGG